MKTPLVTSCDFLPRYREQVLNQVDNPYQTALEQYKASLKPVIRTKINGGEILFRNLLKGKQQ